MDGNQRWDNLNGYTKNSAEKEEKSRIPKEFYLLKVGNLVKETPTILAPGIFIPDIESDVDWKVDRTLKGQSTKVS